MTFVAAELAQSGTEFFPARGWTERANVAEDRLPSSPTHARIRHSDSGTDALEVVTYAMHFEPSPWDDLFSGPFRRFLQRMRSAPDLQAAVMHSERWLAELVAATGSRLPDPQVMATDERGISFAWRIGPSLRVSFDVFPDGSVEWFTYDVSANNTESGDVEIGDELPTPLIELINLHHK